MFWTIYAYDRELVYPKLLDNFVPGWMNHGMVSGLKQMISFYLKKNLLKSDFLTKLSIDST